MMRNPSKHKLVVIIPARSEQCTVGKVIVGLRTALTPWFADFEIIVIDDQSRDATRAVAERCGATVHATKFHGAGLGSAFQLGVDLGLSRGATVLLNIDADGQYRPVECLDLLARWVNGADLVIGDRLAARPDWMRTSRFLTNRAYSAFLTSGLSTPSVDTQSGYRVFTSDLARTCVTKSTFTYTQEQYLLAARRGYQVVSQDVSFLKREFGVSRLVRSTGDYAFNVVPSSLRAKFSQASLGARPQGRHLKAASRQTVTP